MTEIEIPKSTISKMAVAETIASSVTTLPLMSAFAFGLGKYQIGCIWYGIYALAFFYVKQKGKEIRYEMDMWRLISKGLPAQNRYEQTGDTNGDTRN